MLIKWARIGQEICGAVFRNSSNYEFMDTKPENRSEYNWTAPWVALLNL